jgi:hypothetical protein
MLREGKFRTCIHQKFHDSREFVVVLDCITVLSVYFASVN